MEIFLGLAAFAVVLVPIVLAVVNAVRLNNFLRRLQHLERMAVAQANAIEELRSRLVAPARGETPKPPPQATAPPELKTPVVPAPQPQQAPSQPFSVQPEPAWQPSFPLPKKKGRTNKEWEALIGGKILNRIGALALIIGIGFFLKYAFDNNWISETMRVLMGAAAGFGLLYGGYRSHTKDFTIFAQGLVGAGIAILYLSVYAAFNFYHLLPQAAAFALMSVVTMLTLWVAWQYDSLAVALLGWAGGFLTPIMLSTGVVNHVGLFTYLALLDAALLAVVLGKSRWMILEALALAATSFMYLLWYVGDYSANKFGTTLFFLNLFWVLFFGVEAVRVLRRESSALVFRNLIAAAVAMLFFTGLYNLLEPSHHAWMGLVTLLLAVPYYLVFVKLHTAPRGDTLSLQRTILTAILFVITATAIQFDPFETVIVWSLEIAFVVWLGIRWKLKALWLVGAGMVVFAIFKLLFSSGGLSYFPLEEFRLLQTVRAVAHISLIASLIVCSQLLKKTEDDAAVTIGTILEYAWTLVGFAFVSIETNDLFERWLSYADGVHYSLLAYKRLLTLAAVWMLYSVGLSFNNTASCRVPVLHTALGSAALSILVAVLVGISFRPIERFLPVMNYRVLILLMIATGAVISIRLYRSLELTGKWKERIVGVLSLAAVALVIALITGETRDFFQQQIHALESQLEWAEGTNRQLDRLENMKQLSLSGVWLISSIGMMLFGFWRRMRSVRLAAIGLFAFTILKIFIYDLSFLQTLYRIFSFIGLGVILLSVSYLYQRYKHIILGQDRSAAGTNPTAQ
jgi:uncharacterized membrane protein